MYDESTSLHDQELIESMKMARLIKHKSNGGAVKVVDYVLYPLFKGENQVFDLYDFIKETGNGNFGRVCQVRHKPTGRLRACKIIDIQNSAQWSLIQEEVSMLKLLHHPNIMRLFEVFHDGYSIYLIVELCGQSLFDRILSHYKRGCVPLTERQVCSWVGQILSACSYCHKREVVHRDLKPENVLFLN
eukprot:Platyproteum_vivax@DN4020_c0_g1_i1.p1